jgi:hypothetical protein
MRISWSIGQNDFEVVITQEKRALSCNEIGNLYCLEDTDISMVFFTPHHVGHCCTKVTKVIGAQECVLTITLGN